MSASIQADKPAFANQYHDGLTKREYFAACALQGYCSNPQTWDKADTILAEMAINSADALIRELETEK